MDLIFDGGAPVYGAVTDNWPTVEPYFNETGSNCPSVLPRATQAELVELGVRSVQVRRGCGVAAGQGGGVPCVGMCVCVLYSPVRHIWCP